MNKARTSSRYKGVSRHKQSGRWSADIKVMGRKTYLGLFETEEEAARAWQAAAALRASAGRSPRSGKQN